MNAAIQRHKSRYCFCVAGSEVGGIRAVLSAVVRDESSGMRGLMRGWLPAYLRIGPLFLGLPILIEQSRVRLFDLDYLQ